jgi:hypothetical protein
MSRRSNTNNSNTIEMEVSRLFNLKNKQQFTSALLALRNKYKDEELVNKIQRNFSDRHSRIVKGAKKFAEAIRKRYSQSNLPFHQLLSKARAHAHKHGLSESEFAEFQRMYEQELSGTMHKNEVIVPVTNMMKVLGNISTGFDSSSNFKVDESDKKSLEEIIQMNDMSRPLHAQTVLQSLQYTDLNIIALNGKANRTSDNPGDHVHPIIAAMFLPRISLFESHFLHSSICNIVKLRYMQEPLTTRPDYELFYNLVTDPNDVVCDIKSPVSDLLNRSKLQHHLWNSVLHLRNGQAYNPLFREFTSAIDVCRLNKYDNPDMIYGRNDGTILKRLLAAFSFRPTVITTLPIGNVFANNPYAQNVRPTVTSIPMINVRLQQYNSVSARPFSTPKPNSLINLKDSLLKVDTFIEGNKLVQRVSEVMYSREILIFYVDRRANILEYGTPFNLSKLPAAVAGFERINNIEIDVECSITIRDQDKFCLRSVVVAETKDQDINDNDNRKLVIGSSTFLFDYDYVFDNTGKVTDIKGCDDTTRSFLLGNDLSKIDGQDKATINNTKLGALWVTALTTWEAATKALRTDASTELAALIKATNNFKASTDFSSLTAKLQDVINRTPTSPCTSASLLVHYNPMNAFKQLDYYCYDVSTKSTLRDPPLYRSKTKPAGIAKVNTGGLAGKTIPNPKENIKSRFQAHEMIRKNGIIYIYQNFNFVNSEKSIFLV